MRDEFEATVADIREEQRIGGRVRWLLQLDRTEFAAGETGELRARSRGGTLLRVPVLRVSADEAGEVWHTVEKPLAVGTEVTGRPAAAGEPGD